MEDLGLIKMPISNVNPSFWRGKRVFLTGHTGFKGSWLTIWLTSMGAKVTGYALEPSTNPDLFSVAKVGKLMECSDIANICDLEVLQNAMTKASPEIIIHMAAQPLVRYSYRNPVETYATNVMGTVNLLESARNIKGVKAIVVVTTDKCYENKEWIWGYRENEPMGGYDPYSNSKGCSELVVSAYRQSFFSDDKYAEHGLALASARAGNVIGGGDWSEDRIIPDAIRAFNSNESLILRNPTATRPWQHVLEPLSGYLVLAQALYQKGAEFSGAWNFGPRDEDARSVREVIDLLISRWDSPVKWTGDSSIQPHEAQFLKLDCSKARQYLGWRPKWNLEKAIENIVSWNQAFKRADDMYSHSLSQIDIYMKQDELI